MKKIFYAVFLVVICFISNNQVYAMEGNIEKIDTIYKTYNTNGSNTYTRNSSYKLYVDDILTYCITPGITFRSGEGYFEDDYTDLSKDQINKMELISYYGYNYSYHNSIEYYLATQELIHNVLGYNTIYNDGYFNVDYYKDEITRLVSRHNLLPTIDDDIYVIPNKEYTFHDENWVMGDYIIEKSDNVSYAISAQDFIVQLFDNNDGYIKLYKGTDEKTKFYYKDNSQTVADFKLPKKLMKTITIHKKDAGKIKITDIDLATDEPLYGTTYNLLDSNMNILETKTTNYSGEIIFDNYYEYGSYYIEEVSSINYQKNEEIRQIELDSDLKVVDFYHGSKGSISIINISENGKKLDGVFDVYKNNQYVYNLDELTLGNYKIKQTSVQEGYIIDENEYELNITRNNLNQELTIINKQITGSITVKITDEQGKKLSGKYKIYNNSNEVDNEKLYPGTYYIKQTSAKKGYQIDENEYEINITLDNLNQELTIINKQITGSITVKITDENKNELNGSYIVTDKEKNKVENLELIPGIYYVKQLSAQEGYEIDENEYEVSIKLDDLNQELTIINKQITGSIKIINVDEDGNELNGKFVVYDEDGVYVKEEKLIPGIYHIRQIETQDGYEIDKTIYDIEITLDDLNKEVIIINNSNVEIIPKTTGYYNLFILPTLLIIGLVLKRIKYLI